MDDMKKLIERYKQELMEYSKAAAPAPKPMVVAAEETLTVEPETESITEETPVDTSKEVSDKAPQIIGYGGDDVIAKFGEIFGAPVAEDGYADDGGDNYGGVSTVTPEQAEGLDDIPESGEFPEEQLANRDFEKQDEVQNDPDDIQPLEQQGIDTEPPAEQDYATLDEFISVNDRRGTVRFSTSTARGAIPVAGARVVISHDIGGKKHVFYALTTDISGRTPEVTLPAPPKELSEAPDSAVVPYATYDAEVTADGYNDVMIRRLPVFEGVLSVQNIALVPALGQQTEVIEETEPDLNGGM